MRLDCVAIAAIIVCDRAVEERTPDPPGGTYTNSPNFDYRCRFRRWGDGEMGGWGDGEMGRWGDGEMG
ncbi:MAG: hypothetical protein SW833_14240, partial [Cyanobacteriota bacterium]|nr:hypothetical protein [Cyanobacteriota bacterium]